MRFDFANWDDVDYVVQNPWIRHLDWAHLKALATRDFLTTYVPLTMASFALDFHFFGLDPFGYHLTNMLLHLANSVFVYGIIFSLTAQPLAALGGALIFGIHPVQVESVVWISERKNLLSAFFFLMAFALHLRARSKSKAAGTRALEFLAFSAACFAKPSAVIYPLLAFFHDVCWGRFNKSKWPGYAPYVIAAPVFVFLTALFADKGGILVYHQGSFPATLRAVAAAMLQYFELLFAPFHLRLNYEYAVRHSFAYRNPAVSFSVMALLFSGIAVLLKKDRKSFFWAAWYVVLLLPVMNIIPFPSLMNDRYLYLPLIGVFTLLILFLRKRAGAWVSVFLIAAAVSGFAFLNVKRQRFWAEPARVWLETQWTGPAVFWGGENAGADETKPYDLRLGEAYLYRKGDPGRAIECFEKALTSSGSGQLREHPDAHQGLGLAYLQKGNTRKAVYHLERAVGLEPSRAAFHGNLAIALVQQGSLAPAIQEFKKAIELNPGDPTFHNNYASVLEGQGRSKEAEKEFLEAVRLDPDFAEPLFNLGLYYSDTKEWGKARLYWTRFLAAHPQHESVPYVKSRLKALPE